MRKPRPGRSVISRTAVRMRKCVRCWCSRTTLAATTRKRPNLCKPTYRPMRTPDAIRHAEARPGFADRLALDLYRLKLAVGVASAADYVEATQLALRDGFPIEAKKIIDSGFSNGALGSGEHAGRQARLRDLATKS